MWALYKKEIRTFLTSLIGYIVIAVYLVVTSLFLWVFPGSMNIMESEYSSLEAFFYMSPWVFLFLIPAITMRSFSEEQREGTLELLMTKPVTDLLIIFAKYLAGLTLVAISILPTFVYFWSVYALGAPVGNMDVGATWGSYVGLFLVASVYVAIGLFASSFSKNQIVSFLLAALLCFVMLDGFQSLGTFDLFGSLDRFIIRAGMEYHYDGMSKGLIDSRDMIYFGVVTFGFVLITRLRLQARNW